MKEKLANKIWYMASCIWGLFLICLGVLFCGVAVGLILKAVSN